MHCSPRTSCQRHRSSAAPVQRRSLQTRGGERAGGMPGARLHTCTSWKALLAVPVMVRPQARLAGAVGGWPAEGPRLQERGRTLIE